MSKSDKLYKNSPRVEKDEDGNPTIKRDAGKAPPKSDKEDEGLEGNPIEGGEGGVPIQAKEMQDRHVNEMKDMHDRHEKEHKDMHKRHQKETKKVYGDKEGKE